MGSRFFKAHHTHTVGVRKRRRLVYKYLASYRTENDSPEQAIPRQTGYVTGNRKTVELTMSYKQEKVPKQARIIGNSSVLLSTPDDAELWSVMITEPFMQQLIEL